MKWIKIATAGLLLIALAVVAIAYHRTAAWRPQTQSARYRDRLLQNSNYRAALAYSALGDLALKQNRLNEAEGFYRKAVVSEAASPQAHYGMAKVLTIRRNFDAAIAEYREAIELDPYEGEYQLSLANILMVQGQFDAAMQYFEQSLKNRPDPQVHDRLGRLLAAQGRLDEAIRHFRAALASDHEFVPAHQGLAVAFAEKGDAARASYHQKEMARLLKAQRGGAVR